MDNAHALVDALKDEFEELQRDRDYRIKGKIDARRRAQFELICTQLKAAAHNAKNRDFFLNGEVFPVKSLRINLYTHHRTLAALLEVKSWEIRYGAIQVVRVHASDSQLRVLVGRDRMWCSTLLDAIASLSKRKVERPGETKATPNPDAEDEDAEDDNEDNDDEMPPTGVSIRVRRADFVEEAKGLENLKEEGLEYLLGVIETLRLLASHPINLVEMCRHSQVFQLLFDAFNCVITHPLAKAADQNAAFKAKQAKPEPKKPGKDNKNNNKVNKGKLGAKGNAKQVAKAVASKAEESAVKEKEVDEKKDERQAAIEEAAAKLARAAEKGLKPKQLQRALFEAMKQGDQENLGVKGLLFQLQSELTIIFQYIFANEVTAVALLSDSKALARFWGHSAIAGFNATPHDLTCINWFSILLAMTKSKANHPYILSERYGNELLSFLLASLSRLIEVTPACPQSAIKSAQTEERLRRAFQKVRQKQQIVEVRAFNAALKDAQRKERIADRLKRAKAVKEAEEKVLKKSSEIQQNTDPKHPEVVVIDFTVVEDAAASLTKVEERRHSSESTSTAPKREKPKEEKPKKEDKESAAPPSLSSEKKPLNTKSEKVFPARLPPKSRADPKETTTSRAQASPLVRAGINMSRLGTKFNEPAKRPKTSEPGKKGSPQNEPLPRSVSAKSHTTPKGAPPPLPSSAAPPLPSPPLPPDPAEPGNKKATKLQKKEKRKKVMEEERRRMQQIKEALEIGAKRFDQDDEEIAAKNRQRAFKILQGAIQDRQAEKKHQAMFQKLGLICDILNSLLLTPLGVSMMGFVQDKFRHESWRVVFIGELLHSIQEKEEQNYAARRRAVLEKPPHILFRSPPVAPLRSYFTLLDQLSTLESPKHSELLHHYGVGVSRLEVAMLAAAAIVEKKKKAQLASELHTKNKKGIHEEHEVLHRFHKQNAELGERKAEREKDNLQFSSERTYNNLPLLHLSPTPLVLESLLRLLEIVGFWVIESQGAEEAFRVATEVGIKSGVSVAAVQEAHNRRTLLQMVCSLVGRVRMNHVQSARALFFVEDFCGFASLVLPRDVASSIVRILMNTTRVHKKNSLILGYALAIMMGLLMKQRVLPLGSKQTIASLLQEMMVPVTFLDQQRKYIQQKKKKMGHRSSMIEQVGMYKGTKSDAKSGQNYDGESEEEGYLGSLTPMARAKRFCSLCLRLGLLSAVVSDLGPLARITHRVIVEQSKSDSFDLAMDAVREERQIMMEDDSPVVAVIARLRQGRIPHKVKLVRRDIHENKLTLDKSDILNLAALKYHTGLLSLLGTCTRVLFDRQQEIAIRVEQERDIADIQHRVRSQLRQEMENLAQSRAIVKRGGEHAKKLAARLELEGFENDKLFELHDPNNARLARAELAGTGPNNQNNSAPMPRKKAPLPPQILPHPPLLPQPPPPPMRSPRAPRLPHYLLGITSPFKKSVSSNYPAPLPPPPPPPPPPSSSTFLKEDDDENSAKSRRLKTLNKKRAQFSRRLGKNSGAQAFDEDESYSSGPLIDDFVSSDADFIEATPPTSSEEEALREAEERKENATKSRLKNAAKKLMIANKVAQGFKLVKDSDGLPKGAAPKIKRKPKGLFAKIAQAIVQSARNDDSEDDRKVHSDSRSSSVMDFDIQTGRDEGEPNREEEGSDKDDKTDQNKSENAKYKGKAGRERRGQNREKYKGKSGGERRRRDKERYKGGSGRERRKLDRERYKGEGGREKRRLDREKYKGRGDSKHEREKFGGGMLGEIFGEELEELEGAPGIQHISGRIGDMVKMRLKKKAQMSKAQVEAMRRLKDAVEQRGKLAITQIKDELRLLKESAKLAKEQREREENIVAGQQYPALCSPRLAAFFCSVMARIRQIAMYRSKAHNVLAVLRYNQKLLLRLIGLSLEHNHECWKLFEYPVVEEEFEENMHTIGTDGYFVAHPFEPKAQAHGRLQHLMKIGDVTPELAYGTKDPWDGDNHATMQNSLYNPASRNFLFVRDVAITLVDMLASMFEFKMYKVEASNDVNLIISLLEHAVDSEDGFSLFLDEHHVVQMFNALNHLIETWLRAIQEGKVLVVVLLNQPVEKEMSSQSTTSLSELSSSSSELDFLLAEKAKLKSEEAIHRELQVKPGDSWEIITKKRRRQRHLVKKRKQRRRKLQIARRKKFLRLQNIPKKKTEVQKLRGRDFGIFIQRYLRLLYRILLLHPLAGNCFLRDPQSTISTAARRICSVINTMYSKHRYAYQQCQGVLHPFHHRHHSYGHKHHHHYYLHRHLEGDTIVTRIEHNSEEDEETKMYNENIQQVSDEELLPLISVLWSLSSVSRYAEITYSSGAMFTLLAIVALRERQSTALQPYRVHSFNKRHSLSFGVALSGLLLNVVSWRRVRRQITRPKLHGKKKGVGDPAFLNITREVVHTYSAESMRATKEAMSAAKAVKRVEADYQNLASKFGHLQAKERILSKLARKRQQELQKGHFDSINSAKKQSQFNLGEKTEQEKMAELEQDNRAKKAADRKKRFKQDSDKWSSIMLSLFSVVTILTMKEQRLTEIEGHDMNEEAAADTKSGAVSPCLTYFRSLTPALWHHLNLMVQPWPTSHVQPPWGSAKLKGIGRVARRRQKDWRKLMAELGVTIQNYEPRFSLSPGLRNQWLQVLEHLNNGVKSLLSQGRGKLKITGKALGERLYLRQAGEDGQIAGLMSDATMQHLAQRQVLRKEEVWDKFLTAYEMHRDDREQENTLEMEAARAAREKRREKERQRARERVELEDGRLMKLDELDEEEVESWDVDDAADDKVNMVEWVDNEYVGVLYDE